MYKFIPVDYLDLCMLSRGFKALYLTTIIISTSFFFLKITIFSLLLDFCPVQRVFDHRLEGRGKKASRKRQQKPRRRSGMPMWRRLQGILNALNESNESRQQIEP